MLQLSCDDETLCHVPICQWWLCPDISTKYTYILNTCMFSVEEEEKKAVYLKLISLSGTPLSSFSFSSFTPPSPKEHQGQITSHDGSPHVFMSHFLPFFSVTHIRRTCFHNVFDPKARIDLFCWCSRATECNDLFTVAAGTTCVCMCVAAGISHNEVWIHLIKKSVWVGELPQGTYTLLLHRLPLQECASV